MKKNISIKDNTYWQGKVSNYNQLGGIETSILDNGNGKGVRIAWINTGGGLRFKVVLDRAMDIVEAFYNQHSLAWLSHNGIIPPNSSAKSGASWLDSFGGGLLTTCGLTHIGGAEIDEFGERGLHDKISQSRAEIESIKQPTLGRGSLEMSITGRMLQSGVLGYHLELKRTISALLGTPKIKIKDEITNLGNQPTPHMLLYHINFGWPLIDEGTQLIWEGKWTAREIGDFIFTEGGGFKTCKPLINEHRGVGESVAFIDLDADKKGTCHYEVSNSKIPLKVRVEYKKKQLPWLTNWQHWGENEYVTALEPGTHPPIGQSKARREGSLIFIQPGETKYYDLTIEIIL